MSFGSENFYFLLLITFSVYSLLGVLTRQLLDPLKSSAVCVSFFHFFIPLSSNPSIETC